MTGSIYWLLFFSAVITYGWRVLGVYIGRKMDPQSAWFEWLNCVAYALLAGLMSRIMIFPAGLLAETALFSRLLALAVGFGIFFILGRNFLVATFVSSGCFFLLLRMTEGVL